MEVALKMGPVRPSGGVDPAVYMSVLKELLCEELRGVIRGELRAVVRDELQRAGRGSPVCHAGVPPRPSIIEEMLQQRKAAGKRQPDQPAEQNPENPPRHKGARGSGERPPAPPNEEGRSTAIRTEANCDGAGPLDGERSGEQEDGRAKEGDKKKKKRRRTRPNVTVVDRGIENAVEVSRNMMAYDGDRTASYVKRTGEDGELNTALQVNARTTADELVGHPYFAPFAQFKCIINIIYRLDDMFGKIGKTAPPPRRPGPLSRIADSWYFSLLGDMATLSSCAFMAHVADWQVKNYDSSEDQGHRAYIDYGFLIFFTLEVAIRLARYRQYFFFDMNYFANWVDLLMVVGGLVEVITQSSMGALGSGAEGDATMLRLLRMLKLLKVLRVVRIFHSFKVLHALLESLLGSLGDIFWCMLMLVLVAYMFALVFVMRVGSFLHIYGNLATPSEVQELTHYFGSLPSAVLSLLIVTMGGAEWGDQFNALLPTGYFNSGFYLFFVTFTFLALLNVILGIFVDKAMKKLAPTEAEKAREHAAGVHQVETYLQELWNNADADQNDKLSLEEWKRALVKGRLSSWMDSHGLRPHELLAWFELCASTSEDGMVERDLFIRGCMRLRGPSSCFEIQWLILEIHKLHGLLEK